MNSTAKSDIFLSVIESNKGILYKIANSYCKDSEDRKDLVQEIIVQLWKSYENYNDQYKYTTWIYRISLNVAISFYRNQNRRKRLSSPLTEGILNFVDTNETGELEIKIMAIDENMNTCSDEFKIVIKKEQ